MENYRSIGSRYDSLLNEFSSSIIEIWIQREQLDNFKRNKENGNYIWKRMILFWIQKWIFVFNYPNDKIVQDNFEIQYQICLLICRNLSRKSNKKIYKLKFDQNQKYV